MAKTTTEHEATPQPRADFDAIPGIKVESSKEALGNFGATLTSYHIGDITGILGLAITIFAAIQATSAKNAANRAAKSAIRGRERFEMTYKLTDLSNRLKVARDIYNSDDWGRLAHLHDEVVLITTEIRSSENADPELTKLMQDIEHFARNSPIDFTHLKSDKTRFKSKQDHAKKSIEFADQVNTATMRGKKWN